MLSLLLITALALQNPQPAPKTTTATPRSHATKADTASTTSRSTPVSRAVFHDRMRELWTDHIVYTRAVIVSTAAGLPSASEATQRLLRNQDEIGEAIKPYYGDAAGTELASLLRNHIQLAAQALVAAKGSSTAMQPGMNMSPENSANQYQSNQYGQSKTGDTTKSNSQYPGNNSARMNDTTKARQQGSPSATKPAADTSRAKQPANSRVTGDTMSQRLPSNQYGTVRTDSAQKSQYATGQQNEGQQAGQVDSTQLNKAIADLKANGDSIAMFLAKANPRGFSSETLKGAIQQHITLLLQEATAEIKRDWSGSISAFDESLRQATQMADMLSEGIMKQYPSRFSNKATTVSSR